MFIISVKESAVEFANVIKETKEYEELKSAQARVKLDPEAFELVGQLEQGQMRVQQAHSQGLPVENELAQLQSLQQEAMQNEVMKSFFQAQEAFGQVMQEVNQVIARELFSPVG